MSGGRRRSEPGRSIRGSLPVTISPTRQRRTLLRGDWPLDLMGSGLTSGRGALGPASPSAMSAVDVRHTHRPGPFVLDLSVRGTAQDGAGPPTVCVTPAWWRRAVVDIVARHARRGSARSTG